MISFSQCTSDIDNSVAQQSDTGKTVVYCRTRHLAGKLFLNLEAPGEVIGKRWNNIYC